MSVSIRGMEQFVGSSLGQDIDGEALAITNRARLVSNCLAMVETVAIGARYRNSEMAVIQAMFVFTRLGWRFRLGTNLGEDIDGESSGDSSGYSCFAFRRWAARWQLVHHENDGNGNSAGHVRSLLVDGSAWDQVGIRPRFEAGKVTRQVFLCHYLLMVQTVAIGSATLQ